MIDLRKTVKSKTIRGIMIVLIALLVHFFAVTPKEMENVQPTIDELDPVWRQVADQPPTEGALERITEVAQLIGLLYAAYGRAVAQQPLIRKKGVKDEK